MRQRRAVLEEVVHLSRDQTSGATFAAAIDKRRMAMTMTKRWSLCSSTERPDARGTRELVGSCRRAPEDLLRAVVG